MPTLQQQAVSLLQGVGVPAVVAPLFLEHITDPSVSGKPDGQGCQAERFEGAERPFNQIGKGFQVPIGSDEPEREC
ncbi:hypothetical protein N7494_013251 [Penicillium frequentans]|uniref:Uncharacterized protein n=1 Tax=Penicillium frequentans TaxID=3151616 RepID=A0AAD6CHY0_9EURO|nr:hypothetical protein N7494_013251 [Penicillium glabrum]